MTWLEVIEEAFGTTENELHLSEIYKCCLAVITKKSPEKLNNSNYEAAIRNTIEVNSIDSEWYNKRNNRFRSTKGKGKGYWKMI